MSNVDTCRLGPSSMKGWGKVSSHVCHATHRTTRLKYANEQKAKKGNVKAHYCCAVGAIFVRPCYFARAHLILLVSIAVTCRIRDKLVTACLSLDGKEGEKHDTSINPCFNSTSDRTKQKRNQRDICSPLSFLQQHAQVSSRHIS